MKQKQDANNTLPNLLKDKNFSTMEIRQWTNLQRIYYDRDGLALIEYDPEAEQERYWHMYIEPQREKRLFRGTRKNTDLQLKLNEDLEKCFGSADFRVNKSFWQEMTKLLQWKAIFLPYQELQRLSNKQLQDHLTFLKLKIDYFPFVEYLSVVKQQSMLKEAQQIPFPLVALWYQFIYYVDFLRIIAEKEPMRFAAAQELFKEHYSQLNFDHRLPCEQIIEVLFRLTEQSYLPNQTNSDIDRLIKQAAPSVQDFFTQHLKTLKEYIAQKPLALKKVSLKDPRNIIRDHFFSVSRSDLDLVKIQELLDDQSGQQFMLKLPSGYSEEFGKSRKKNLADRLKAVVGDASIMDRIQAVADSVQSSPQPLFGKLPEPFYHKNQQQWHQLNEEERQDLLQASDAHLKEEDHRFFSGVAFQRWMRYFENLLNQRSIPFLHWETEQGYFIPQWNFLGTERAKSLREDFKTKRMREDEEIERLEKLLPELFKIETRFALKRFVKGFKGFDYATAQERWEQALRQHEITIENRSNYRIRRMREFGILEADEKVNDRKEVWLNEMLRIEEEVKPYILYVRQAFQAALPVRRTVEFDPYRHSSDGLEFDPETAQDPDKWIRADVMRNLKRKVNRGVVDQVNTFCLDASGSMDHEPMRNLFKILYLLILGLEDRKSYDAVHFFNYYFIETADFSDSYTNRSLLFKILRKIATVGNGDVIYGGGGGTNISDGVHHCHERMINFVKNLREENPEKNIVCSLFVITDGEPSMGIMNLDELKYFIQAKRELGDVAIKGIYIKPEDDQSQFVPYIFGEDNCVETTSFHDAVDKFVRIMTQTYKAQRKAYKWKIKQAKLAANNKDTILTNQTQNEEDEISD